MAIDLVALFLCGLLNLTRSEGQRNRVQGSDEDRGEDDDRMSMCRNR